MNTSTEEELGAVLPLVSSHSCLYWPWPRVQQESPWLQLNMSHCSPKLQTTPQEAWLGAAWQEEVEYWAHSSWLRGLRM